MAFYFISMCCAYCPMAIAQRGGRMRGVKRAHSQPRARIERQRNRAFRARIERQRNRAFRARIERQRNRASRARIERQRNRAFRARIEPRGRNRAAATGVCAQGTKWRAHSRRKKRKKAHFCSVLRGRVIKMAGGGADVCVVRSVGYWWIDELIRD